MNNMIVLQKNDEGHIICWELSDKGVKLAQEDYPDEGLWEEPGRIEVEEIEEILNKTRNV